jgi:predicted membrane chloride channel (bestrophin family)
LVRLTPCALSRCLLPQGFTLAGSSISFLLVFRSQISYGRFWEGRGHLGNIMMHGRNLGRQIALCVRNDDGPAGLDKDVEVQRKGMHRQSGFDPNMGDYQQDSGCRREMEKMCGFRRLQMIRLVIMFWRLLVHHARDETEGKFVEQLWLVAADAKDTNKRKVITTPHQESLLKSKKRRPLVAVAMLTWYVRHEYRSKNITHMEFLALNEDLKGLINGFNGVDKVHNVPVPFPYAQMILLFLCIYVFAAPFLFVAHFGWACILPSLVLTLAFFGINEVALEIEDPFGEDENDLPLDPMGDALKADCEMNLEIAAVPPNNMKLYWEEISKSKQRYKKIEKDRMEQDVKRGIQQQTIESMAQAGVAPPPALTNGARP